MCMSVEVTQCYKHQWSLFTCPVSLKEAVVYQGTHTDTQSGHCKDPHEYKHMCVLVCVCVCVCDYYPIIVSL